VITLTIATTTCNAYGSLTTPSLEAGGRCHAANAHTTKADTRHKHEQYATQPTPTQTHDAGGATKPKQNTSNPGRQAIYTTDKQAASSYQSADAATPVQVPPTATT
jgi:hypothetical protein